MPLEHNARDRNIDAWRRDLTRLDTASVRSAADRATYTVDVDDVLDDSFPASDPPSWTSLRSGPPAARIHANESRHTPFTGGRT